MRPEPDGSHADWWLDTLEPWGREVLEVGQLVPPSFPAVCQVLHPFVGVDDTPIRWAELARRAGFASVRDLDATRQGLSLPAADDAQVSASRGEVDEPTARALVEVLTASTSAPDDVFVAFWGGWGDLPAERFPGAGRVATEARGHHLLRGPLRGVLEPVTAPPFGRRPDGLWWPADRAWFVTTEIEFEWTFVAGPVTLIDRLRADERLEVAGVSFASPATRAGEPG